MTKVGEAKPTIYHQQINGNQIKHYEQFIKLLSEKYQETRDANVYAKWVGTTYKTLNQTCKAITQQTAKQVIDSFIILEAKRRLSIDSIQIQQLAELLGFDEATNFVKFFKKHTSLTPTQFKKSTRFDINHFYALIDLGCSYCFHYYFGVITYKDNP